MARSLPGLRRMELPRRGAARGARAPAAGGGRATPASEAGLVDMPPRVETGIRELDRVLGGGLVAGSLVLLGGDPGIGKSTLLLQALDGLAASGDTILYASGEESVAQTGIRAGRLGVAAPSLLLLAETNLERILVEADREKPRALAIDSVQ